MIVVIEPHADDAFLSVGGLLELWIKSGIEVGIVTVYSATRKRARDAKAYADAIGAKWWGMGGTEYGSMKPGDPTGIFPSGEEAIAVWTLLSAPNGVHRILLPLGIGGHPEHVQVRDMFHDVLVPPPGIKINADIVTNDIAKNGATLLYYVDQPYAAKLKNQTELDETLHGRRIFSVFRPGARKYRHVPLFKDQAYFFFNENGKDDTLAWKTFELVVY